MSRNKMPEVSIIVTVYNKEKYIAKCLESCTGQTYEDIEIVVVNDGSTDGSLEICRKYEKKDSRIILIDKPNGGLVNASKAGVERATGKYIVPLDGDDWLEKDMVEAMISKAILHDADIAQCEIRYVYENGEDAFYKEPLEEGYYDLKKEECPLYDYMFWGKDEGLLRLRSNMCTCMIKRDLFYNIQMSIPEIISNGEDDARYYSTLLNAQSFYIVRKPLYDHLILMDSMGHSADQYSMDQLYALDEFLYGQVKKHRFSKKLLWKYRQYYAYISQLFMTMTHDIRVESHFDFGVEEDEKGKNIVVYGAGKAGKSYMLQNDKYHWNNIVLWVDKKGPDIWQDKEIASINSLFDNEYDYIFIAIENERVVRDIRKELIGLGIEDSKIHWKQIRMMEFSNYLDCD